MLNNSVDGDDGSLSTIIDAMAEHTEIPATNKSELCKAEKNFLARKLYASWLVHIFTTTGVLCALYGIVDIFNDRPARALIWLVIAQIIDGLDGPMARSVDVKKFVPVIDGNVLDLVIDYMTCVVVPVLFILHFAMFPRGFELIMTSLIMISSVLWFSRKDIETNDMWFRGFPAGWNMVVTALWLCDFGHLVNMITSIVFIILTMTPSVKFFHILGSLQLRKTTISITSIMIIVMVLMIFLDGEHHNGYGKLVIVAWLAYYFATSIWRSLQGDELTDIHVHS